MDTLVAARRQKRVVYEALGPAQRLPEVLGGLTPRPGA
jgi:hypothetical protein